MGKLRKKPNVEFSAAPVSVPPVKTAESGKRGAKEAPEKPASSKKHKIEVEKLFQTENNAKNLKKLFQKENNAKKLKKDPIDAPMEKKDETNSLDSEEEAYVSTNAGKSTAKPSKKDSSSDEDDNDSTDESSDEEASKSQQHHTKRGTDRSIKDAFSADAKRKETSNKSDEPNTPAYQDGGSGLKTLFVGNLSFEATRDNVLEFFKRAGKVVDVQLAAKEDGSFWGFGHVEFAAEEDAQKALCMNHEMLLGCSVRLDLARERGSSERKKGRKMVLTKKGGEGPGQTVFVAGFGRSLDDCQHRDKLEECFRSCGKIVRVIIPQDNCLSKGFAYVLFADRGAASKALGLNGTVFKGCILTVELAKNDARFCKSRGSKGKSTIRVGSHDGGGKRHEGYTLKAEEPKLDSTYSGGRGRSASGVVGSDDGGVRGRGRGGRGRGGRKQFHHNQQR